MAEHSAKSLCTTSGKTSAGAFGQAATFSEKTAQLLQLISNSSVVSFRTFPKSHESWWVVGVQVADEIVNPFVPQMHPLFLWAFKECRVKVN